MKVRFTPRATRDLANIADYIGERSPQAALGVRDAILESLQNLALFPELGRRQTTEDVRKIVTRRYPYIVYYRIVETATEIEILAIQHPARERAHADD
jgi:plasmid stabilization system protein ParE